MTNNSIITTDGKNALLYRAFTVNASLSATSNLAPTVFEVGISNNDITVSDTSLTFPIPISTGTICDAGNNSFTGSLGGTNSTNNTTTYKEVTGTSDNTSQNLIANNSSVSKTWTKAALTASLVSSKPFAAWFYIKDATTLSKFLSSGTALELRFRTTGDAANKYYSYTRTAAQLTVLWNWVSSNTANVSTLTLGAGGAPSGALNEAVIIITTNNATDTFIAGDVLYDALRQWSASDLIKAISAGYPTFDTATKSVTIRCYLNSLEALGFYLNSLALYNQDTAPKITNLTKINGESKSITDEFAFTIVNRVV